MYPFFRMAKEIAVHARSGPLPLLGTHVSHHMCWPWDIDPWLELNNGRTLTLYDLGRIPWSRRIGLVGALGRRGWGMAMAGGSVRWRKRVLPFDRFSMTTRLMGWDARFFYVDQAMWKGEEAASALMGRTAVTGPSGIVPPQEVVAEMGHDPVSPPLPDWVGAWIAADAGRVWPPERREQA